MPNKFTQKLAKLKHRFFLDENEKSFIKFATKKWGRTGRARTTQGEVLIDALPYYPYLFKAAYVANFLAAEYKLEIRTAATDYSTSWLHKYIQKFNKFGRIYRSFGCAEGLNYTSLSSREISECEQEAASILDRIESKEDLLEVQFEGIKVGDLIYDSYLRENACATVGLKDPRLLALVKMALVIFRSCKKYIASHDVKKIVLSHVIYIQYGILARLASRQGIDVYLFPIRLQIVHKPAPPHYLQTTDHLEYRSEFLSLGNKENRLAQARAILSQRLSGVVDAGTYYMVASAYSATTNSVRKVFRESGRSRLVVMLHCFFDAPHIYRDMLFPDFHEWVDFTLSVAEQTDFDVYVKPHPNGLPGNDAIVEYFKNKYPKAIFIDKSIPNNQLIAEGIDAAITVNGTLGHEFPYLGVPVITAGDNPHSAYGFCNQARSKAEYESLIRNADKLPRNISRAEIEEFFYMHYLYPGYGRLEGNNDLFDFGKRNLYQEGQHSTMLRDLVSEAESGKFDDVSSRFAEAMSQVERQSTQLGSFERLTK